MIVRIETDLGEFEVRRPTLAGWVMIFDAVPREDLERLVDVVLALPERITYSQLFAAGKDMLATLPRVPMIAAALCAACLADPETGKRALTTEQALQLDDVALDAVLSGLREGGIWEDVKARLKKWLSPRPETGEEQGQRTKD